MNDRWNRTIFEGANGMNFDAFLADAYNDSPVAVIGGSGQVGTYLCEFLRKHGANVKVYDKVGNQKHLDIVCEPLKLLVQIVQQEPDYVFNLAGHVEGVTKNEMAHFEMCLDNTLLQSIPLWAARHLSETRFVQISTVCVLPRNAPVPSVEIPVDQLGLPEPTNLGYGLAKQLGEWLAKFATKEAPYLNPLVIRPSNLYGLEPANNPHGHVIPRLTWRLLQREDPFVIRGLPTTRRAFFHAADCAEAIAILGATEYCGTVNVGPDSDIAIEDLLEILCDIVGWWPSTVEWGRESEQGYAARLPDTSLMATVLEDAGVACWKPRIGLERGLEEYVSWTRSQMRMVA